MIMIYLEFKYSLRGVTGDEKITVTVGDKETPVPIATEATEYEVQGSKIIIKFNNDNGVRDVHFKSQSHFAIIGPSVETWKSWKCGLADENIRCSNVRDGLLAWNGEYILEFGGMVLLFVLPC